MSLLELEDFSQEIDKLTSVLDRRFSIIPKFGVEIEFYLRDQGKKLVAVKEVENFKKELGANGIILEEEKGLNQFEIQINHTSNISRLLNSIDAIKSNLVSTAEKLGSEILFDPKPFKNDYGSSMHFHLSLHEQGERNIFSEGTISTNKLLNSVISAVLLMLNQSLYFICGDSLEEYDRFIPNFMAPVNVSWGGNNRTTAVRIPESNVYNRRIEFRIPSASLVILKKLYFSFCLHL